MESKSLIEHSLSGQSFGYSAADLGDLGATEYTLVTIAVDVSGSTYGFKNEMEKCIQEAIKACKLSPRSDYLMVRLVSFNEEMKEIHGFKQLPDCILSDYDNFLNPAGCTLLFDTVKNVIDATNNYGEQLSQNDYGVNAIIIIITDGADNRSHNIPKDIGRSLKKAREDEFLESVISILVGVNVDGENVDGYLDKFRQEAEITQYVSIKDATEKEFAKLTNFISKSISAQSSSLGTGSMSTPLVF